MVRKPFVQEHHIVYKDETNPKRQRDLTVMIRSGVHSIVTKIGRFNGMTLQEVYSILMAALMQVRFDDAATKLVEQFSEMMERRAAKDAKKSK